MSSQITVTTLLFASYADAVGRSSVPVTLAAPATVGALVEHVRALPGADRLPPAPLVAVNASYASSRPVAGRGRRGRAHSAGRGRVSGRVSAIVTRPLDPAALLAAVADAGHGATALFIGTVREVNDGRAVTGIDYSAYEAMAERELAAILAEAAARFATDEGAPRLAAEHRVGTLGIGEASVAVAAAHARRAPAMDAVRYAVEELKRRVPIWKREHYADGTREWLDPTAVASPVSAGAAS